MKEVAVGIVRNGERVLACQRKRDAVYPLKWEFPGGKREEGEMPVQTVQRELREELGIEATLVREFHTQEWTYPDGEAHPGSDGVFRVFYFLVERFSGTPSNRVFEEIRWVTPEELASMDVLDGNHEAVNLLLNHERGQTLR
jgi:8-oxo-dGTP diphosphatase